MPSASGNKKCMHCGGRIQPARVEFLLTTGRPLVCVSCAGETKRLVLMEYGHKTAGYAVVVPRGDETKALRCYRRSR